METQGWFCKRRVWASFQLLWEPSAKFLWGRFSMYPYVLLQNVASFGGKWKPRKGIYFISILLYVYGIAIVCLFKVFPFPQSSKDNLHSDSSGSTSDFWVAHCIIKDVNFFKGKQKVKVIMYLHQSASTIPEGLFDEEGYRCTLELIHRTLPQRYKNSHALIRYLNKILFHIVELTL